MGFAENLGLQRRIQIADIYIPRNKELRHLCESQALPAYDVCSTNLLRQTERRSEGKGSKTSYHPTKSCVFLIAAAEINAMQRRELKA